VTEFRDSTMALLHWLEANNHASYDRFDLWASKPGVWGKRLFGRHKLLGLPLVAPIFVIDTFFPRSRRFFVKKARSAEAIPRIAMGYFRLYEMQGNHLYLERGLQLLRWLEENASHSAHGIGWGLRFDWQAKEFVPRTTPCVTVTSHSTEAFLEGFRLTGEEKYRQIALKSADFVMYDLHRRVNNDSVAISYTPVDHNFVINANSFGARILLLAYRADKDPEKLELIRKIVNYIVDQQNADGSWFYSDKDDVPPNKNFIDSFHTGYVVEHLFEVWQHTQDPRTLVAIERGREFMLRHLVNDDFSIPYYYSYHSPTGIKVDIRGCAEMIRTFTLLSEHYKDDLEVATNIARWTIENMRSKKGYFYLRIFRTHTNRLPCVRWGQAPMFNALTFLMTKNRGRPSPETPELTVKPGDGDS
jgi:hypothetical protein